MEEMVGRWWHRAVTRAADTSHAHAAVSLAQMQRSITLLFRAAGGPATVRIAPSGTSRHGGPRGWLQRVAGSGERVHQAELEPEVLALPPVIAVFDDAALNRELYLWLAALAACMQPSGNPHAWVADNRAATTLALQHFPGLQASHARLLSAHLAQRPNPAHLRGTAALSETALRAALQGMPTPHPVLPTDVAPVPLWLTLLGHSAVASSAQSASAAAEHGTQKPALTDAQRRRAERVTHGREQAPLMMFFRAESIFSWGEFVRVNRATDDDDDGNQLSAANDMDTLAVSEGGQASASRVKFDLDLPSAAADDLPLGPGIALPEWDYKHGRLLPDHCRVQCRVARAGEPFQPSPALRATARRVRRRLQTLRAAPHWVRGQPQGDMIDLDAWVRFSSEAQLAPHSDSPPVYCQRQDHERSLATLLLADLSLSTDAYISNEQRVIDVIREALYVFGEALTATGDAFEMLGFSSVRRQHVRVQHLKGFDEAWGNTPRARVGAIKPGYYTRMGAAIRLATQRLQARPERQRVLLILTDGKPNDLDIYEGRYGLEDTRHAVQAARSAGLLPFCLTIDERAHDYLPMLFGEHGYVRVQRPQELPARLALVYAQLTR